MQKRGKIDLILFICIIILLGLGILNVYSQTIEFSSKIIKRHVISIAVSIILALFVYFSNFYQFINRNIMLVICIGFFLILLPIIFRKYLSVNGSSRWITIGFFSLQPSEIIKIILVMFYALWFSKKNNTVFSFSDDILPPLLVTLSFLVIVYLQKDLSTAFLLFIFMIAVLFVVNVPLLVILYFMGMAVSLFTIFSLTEGYRAQRIIAYLAPFRDTSNVGYQVVQSFKFINSGGLLGKGLGWTISSNYYLPLSYSDYAYSAIVCELGIISGIFIILAYFIIGIRGFTIASKLSNRYEYCMVMFATSFILLQALLNIAVATGLLPPTGLTLPFVSYGGTSLLIFLVLAMLIFKMNTSQTDTNAVRYI